MGAAILLGMIILVLGIMLLFLKGAGRQNAKYDEMIEAWADYNEPQEWTPEVQPGPVSKFNLVRFILNGEMDQDLIWMKAKWVLFRSWIKRVWGSTEFIRRSKLDVYKEYVTLTIQVHITELRMSEAEAVENQNARERSNFEKTLWREKEFQLRATIQKLEDLLKEIERGYN